MRGVWQNDRLNGIAKLITQGVEEDVVYKDDLLIRVNSKLTRKEKAYIALSAITSVGTYRYFLFYREFMAASYGGIWLLPVAHWLI